MNARSFRATDDAIGEDFERAENYLSMVGLVIVILGGIAVSSVTRVFILQKFRSIAVLKCVGARSAQIITVYLLQVLALGLAGSLLGVVLARGAIAAIPLFLPAGTPILADVEYGVTPSAAAQGIGIGRARVAAVLGRAAAAGAAGQAVAAAARRVVRRAVIRLAAVGGDGVGLGRARRADGLAGGIAQRRPDRLRRLLRRRACPPLGGPPAGARRLRRCRTPGRFRCATPCCTFHAPATRRASSSSPSASAPSSSSASARCRRACWKSSTWGPAKPDRTCS